MLTMVAVAAGALVVLPGAPAMAGVPGADLNCTIVVTTNITPGITTTAQTVALYSVGATGTATCTGTIDGATVTGAGSFGIAVVETASCFAISNGLGVFTLTAPTTGGTKTEVGTFQTSGTGGGASFTGDLAGALTAITDPVGDCFNTPTTVATAHIDAHVS